MQTASSPLLGSSNPLLPEPFSTLTLSIDARSALHIFAAAFAVIERLAPFVICQLSLRMSATRKHQSRQDSCRHTARCLDHHEQFYVPATREGTLQHKPIATSYSRASQLFF